MMEGDDRTILVKKNQETNFAFLVTDSDIRLRVPRKRLGYAVLSKYMVRTASACPHPGTTVLQRSCEMFIQNAIDGQPLSIRIQDRMRRCDTRSRCISRH